MGNDVSKVLEVYHGVIRPFSPLSYGLEILIVGDPVKAEQDALAGLTQSSGCDYPGSDYRPSDRKTWMAGLEPGKLTINKIVWPGTHDSATNQIGIPLITRRYAECQNLSIYEQLVEGTRLLDIRVREDRLVCHGPIVGYSVDVVLEDVKRFLSETVHEIIILEVRTEFDHNDPPEFDKYLVEKLGDHLIRQNDNVFKKTVTDLLPRRVICIWKPRNSAAPQAGSLLWSAKYLQDDWINTNMPFTKFQGNLDNLSKQPPVSQRGFFYRVENTLTFQPVDVYSSAKEITNRIRGHARLFVAQCVSKGIVDRLQVLSTDFIDADFVDACVGLTHARVQVATGWRRVWWPPFYIKQ